MVNFPLDSFFLFLYKIRFCFCYVTLFSFMIFLPAIEFLDWAKIGLSGSRNYHFLCKPRHCLYVRIHNLQFTIWNINVSFLELHEQTYVRTHFHTHIHQYGIFCLQMSNQTKIQQKIITIKKTITKQHKSIHVVGVVLLFACLILYVIVSGIVFAFSK